MRQYKSTIPSTLTLDGSIISSTPSITLSAEGNIPAIVSPDTFTLVIEPGTANEEIVYVTAHTAGTKTFTVTRGQEGTSAISHSSGVPVKHAVTASDLSEPHYHINASSYATNNSKSVHGIGSTDGSVVGTSKTQTLTNKTIDSANNTITVAQSRVTNLTTDLAAKAPLAGPTFTGTVVLPSTTSIGNVTSTEIGYIDGVTSAIQTQLDAKAPTSGPTFTGTVVLPSTTTINGYNVVAKPIGSFTRSTTFSSSGLITFDQEDFDTNNAHSTSTNAERYTPSVAGYYRATFSGSVGLSSSSSTSASLSLFLRKNDTAGTGSSVAPSITNAASTSVSVTVPFNLTAIFNLNGSTDYINCRALNTGGYTISSSQFTVEWIGA